MRVGGTNDHIVVCSATPVNDSYFHTFFLQCFIKIRIRVFFLNKRDRVYMVLFSIAYIDKLYAFAYIYWMDIIARTPQQLGAAIRRTRRARKITQDALGQKMHARQATVSKLEAGEPATQLQTLMDALTALELELVIRPRTTVSNEEIEDLF